MSVSRYGYLSVAVLCCILCFTFFAKLNSQEPEKLDSKNIRDFMRVKLKLSQELLEGIAVEDLDKVAKNAQKISLLSREESWKVFQTEEYQQHSTEFRRTADELTEAAKKKNVDGAALKYVELTMKCFTCHKYIRGIRMANAEGKR